MFTESTPSCLPPYIYSVVRIHRQCIGVHFDAAENTDVVDEPDLDSYSRRQVPMA